MKLLCLLSGGIDSIVASYLMLQKGHNIVYIHFHNWPFTTRKNWNKSKELVSYLAKKLKRKFEFNVVHHGANLVEFKKAEGAEGHLTCVLCRRAMLREAEILAKKLKCDALLTGEAVGQVASQVLQNMSVEHQAVKIPVVRPLIGMNKQDIIAIAKEIGTYDISVGVSCDCRAVPNKPTTNADLNAVLAVEKEVGVGKLAKKAISKGRESEVIDGKETKCVSCKGES